MGPPSPMLVLSERPVLWRETFMVSTFTPPTSLIGLLNLIPVHYSDGTWSLSISVKHKAANARGEYAIHNCEKGISS